MKLTHLAGLATALGILGATTPTYAATIPTSLLAKHPAMRQQLQQGDAGHWVSTLQADLKILGYHRIRNVNGYFGDNTLWAVKEFQERHHMTQSGVTTPATWQDILAKFGLVAPINKNISATLLTQSTSTLHADRQLAKVHPAMRQWLHRGSRGSWVYTLQADLKLAGYSASTGNIDGIFGPQTQRAVKAFQKQHDLTPTGMTGIATWAALLKQLRVFSTATSKSSPSRPTVTTKTVLPASSTKYIDGRPVLKTYKMIATAYGPSLKNNYPYGPVDAFGQPLQAGMIAVDPSVIPLKSTVYVKGYQDAYLPSTGFVGHAMDTGGAIKGNRIDVFMNHNPQIVSNFGIQPVTVYLLGK